MASLHPYYETAVAKQRREFREEITAFLKKVEVQTARLTGHRVLEIIQ
ncbi:hypothetical protein [Mesorhizobium sp. STM 4661]|nr:hypothetical protein [Mesorhizobium sp. STM 4661]